MPNQKTAVEAVTVADIAAALGIIKRNAERRAKKEQWPYREEPARGGKRRLYCIVHLPTDVRAALALRSINSLSASSTQHAITAPADQTSSLIDSAGTRATSFSSDPRDEELARSFERKTEKQKAAAHAALVMVQECHTLTRQGHSYRAVAQTLAHKHGVSPATLSRAWKKVRRQPHHLWLYLLTKGYAGRAARLEMSAEAWEVLKADYLRLERPTAKACIQRLRERGRAEWTLPSDRTMERRLNELPRALKVLAREGRKAALDLYPAQQRSRAALAPLSIVNGDGYKHNLFVRFPDGRIERAKTWVWQDVYSSRILAWRTDRTEHTDVIRLSFGDLVEAYGIPEAVLLDNTLAAANKTMSGGVRHRFRFKVKDEEPLGVFPLFGTKVMWATPGRGQAKPVERVFGIGGVGEYIDKAPELAGAWTGANPFDRPDQDEYDGRSKAVELAELERIIAREVAAWNAREGRRGAMHAGGKSCDALFEEARPAEGFRRPVEHQRRLWLLSTEPVRASARDGTITLDHGRVVGERLANRYWSSELIDYAGRMVSARFDPARLHEGVHVYSASGAYLCFASCVQAAGFNDANAAREQARDRNAVLRAARQIREAEQRMDLRDAVKALAGADHPVIPAPAAKRGNVVRGEFRDPLERPVPHAAPDTSEQAAEREALRAELAKVVPIAEPDDAWVRLRRWNALGERLARGEQLPEDDWRWHAAYGASDECQALTRMAQDFPEKLRERAAG